MQTHAGRHQNLAPLRHLLAGGSQAFAPDEDRAFRRKQVQTAVCSDVAGGNNAAKRLGKIVKRGNNEAPANVHEAKCRNNDAKWFYNEARSRNSQVPPIYVQIKSVNSQVKWRNVEATPRFDVVRSRENVVFGRRGRIFAGNGRQRAVGDAAGSLASQGMADGFTPKKAALVLAGAREGIGAPSCKLQKTPLQPAVLFVKPQGFTHVFEDEQRLGRFGFGQAAGGHKQVRFHRAPAAGELRPEKSAVRVQPAERVLDAVADHAVFARLGLAAAQPRALKGKTPCKHSGLQGFWDNSSEFQNGARDRT